MVKIGYKNGVPKIHTIHGRQTIHKHATELLTEKHIKYKDITSHSPQLRSKRQ